jgi:hypothetical protein
VVLELGLAVELVVAAAAVPTVVPAAGLAVVPVLVSVVVLEGVDVVVVVAGLAVLSFTMAANKFEDTGGVSYKCARIRVRGK